MFHTTTTFRMLVDDGEIPMGSIKELRDQLTFVYEYLRDLSLGSTDEVILVRDASKALAALALLDKRGESDGKSIT